MPSLYTRRAIIVTPASLAPQANAGAKQNDLDPVGGEKTFTVPLSATGSLPATHYWCNWQMTPDHWDAAQTRIKSLGAEVRVFDASTITPQEVLDTLGLQTIATTPEEQ